MRRLRRIRKCESGQALVEFALVVPILLILVIGVFEFGRAWNSHQVITDAAREGARRAVIYDVGDPEVRKAEVKDAIGSVLASAALKPARATITFPDGFNTGTGNVTAVRIVYPYQFQFLAPFIRLVADSPEGSINLATEARMRNE